MRSSRGGDVRSGQSRLRLGHLQLWSEGTEGTLTLLDVVLGVVWHVLLLGLQPVHLQLDAEFLVQVSEVDQVGEVKLTSVQAVRGGDHLGGNTLTSALDQTEEVVDELPGLAAPHEVDEL